MPKKAKINPPKAFFFSIWGYSRKDFQKWGKQGNGGRPAKYVSDAERQMAYRRRKSQNKLYSGKSTGILSMRTGRISKYRSSAEKQRAYRLRKKLNVAKT